MKKETIVISVGGSLIVPDEIDTKWLRDFKKFILNNTDRYRFILISGGGRICRKYNAAAQELREMSNLDLDLLGIQTTRLNGYFLKTIFENKAYEEVVINPTIKIKTDKDIIVGAGYEPGTSTDMDAVLMAKTNGVKKVINLSNIDYVYDKDPKKFKDAKKIEKISWKDFRNKVLPKEWISGSNTPFDVTASAMAEKLGVEVAIMNGHNLDNLQNYLSGKSFVGSLIK
jgi:uridylate kinase